MTKDEAQRRADQIRAFQAELATLSREGVPALTPEHAGAIAAHHRALLASLSTQFDIDRTDATRRMSLGLRLASAFGAAALTAAVVSFFYRIWGSLSPAVEVALLTAAPLVALGATIEAARRERTLYIASLCAIVACGALVLQTVMLGDLFNLRGTPHAVAIWAAFGFAVSLPYRFAIPFAGAVLASMVYVAALSLMAAGAPWTAFTWRAESLLAAAAVAYAAWGRAPLELQAWMRGTTLVVGLAALLALSTFDGHSVLPIEARAAGFVYQVVAVVLAFAITAHGLRTARSETVVIGAAFAGLFLIGRFVDWWWDWMPKYLFFLILAAIAIGSIGLLRRLRARYGEAA